MSCATIAVARSMLFGVVVPTYALVELPKVAESAGLLDQRVFVPVMRSPSTQFCEVRSQFPPPSCPSGSLAPFASHVRLRARTVLPAERAAATAADMHTTRDRSFRSFIAFPSVREFRKPPVTRRSHGRRACLTVFTFVDRHRMWMLYLTRPRGRRSSRARPTRSAPRRAPAEGAGAR